jgi:hypothetical protein
MFKIILIIINFLPLIRTENVFKIKANYLGCFKDSSPRDLSSLMTVNINHFNDQ